MSVLDIEVPGTVAAGTSAVTKNFTIETSGGGSTTNASQSYVISATRLGSTPYVLSTVVNPNGTAKRYCAAAAGTTAGAAPEAAGATTDIGKICNAITSGNPVNGNW